MMDSTDYKMSVLIFKEKRSNPTNNDDYSDLLTTVKFYELTSLNKENDLKIKTSVTQDQMVATPVREIVVSPSLS